ncbi:hypothetical protein VKT23_011988 [Stygiomarasmius scandens]|uniref:Cytochrome P450 n=1 Tax=Marasmiellus scandens TaxID=2682957 RepID=A0ABR1J7H2_9AGAR
MSISLYLLSIPVLIIIYKLTSLSYAQISRLPLPPGPKGFPFLGNVADSFAIEKSRNPSQHQWAHYLDLSKKYNSDVIHINILGEHVVVLNSVKATNEVLEKRAGLSSDRPCGPGTLHVG